MKIKWCSLAITPTDSKPKRNMKTYIFTSTFLVFINQSAYGAEAECYPTVDAYMTASYGENYKDDENISAHKDIYGGNIFYIVADKTSGTNYSRSLLRENASGKFCLILSTPPIAQLIPRAPDEFGVPQKFVATD